MPAFSPRKLSDSQVQNLIAYLRSLPTPTPRGRPREGPTRWPARRRRGNAASKRLSGCRHACTRPVLRHRRRQRTGLCSKARSQRVIRWRGAGWRDTGNRRRTGYDATGTIGAFGGQATVPIEIPLLIRHRVHVSIQRTGPSCCRPSAGQTCDGRRSGFPSPAVQLLSARYGGNSAYSGQYAVEACTAPQELP
jgi:hypothetical protein